MSGPFFGSLPKWILVTFIGIPFPPYLNQFKERLTPHFPHHPRILPAIFSFLTLTA